ncbi:MAG: methyltransferase domain-containing protein, partial [Aliifodinibius sp.]|nr:methyltransferase domain-containing protein [Fodinibius sp.]NIY27236.1 methyltransferase domain-containing protein [Fodinibius sp.]
MEAVKKNEIARALNRAFSGIADDLQEWLLIIGEKIEGDGTKAMADLWNEAKPKNENIIDWYCRRDVSVNMVRELASWHEADENVRKQNESIIQHLRGPRVLDFGAGIGTLAIAISLAYPDMEIDVFEPGPACREFMEWRSEKLGAKINVHVNQPRPQEFYNTIIAMDVAEHLQRPAYLIDFAWQYLDDNGILACNWVFHKDELHPQHIAECTKEANEFHCALREKFGPRDDAAVVHINGWPSIHERINQQDMCSDYWDEQWSDVTRRDDKWPLYQEISKAIEKHMGDENKTSVRVLDIGCGAGALLDRLSAIDGVISTGFDFSPVAVETCKAKGRHAIITDVKDLQIFGIDEGDGADVVICSDLMSYVRRKG